MWNEAPWANGIDRYSDGGLGVIGCPAESRRLEAIVEPKADKPLALAGTHGDNGAGHIGDGFFMLFL